jgi:M6 family metalloprotease-like protein
MKRLILNVLIGCLALSLNISPATAAVKPGGACKQVGKVVQTAGMKYKCVKSGKKFVWSKGQLVVKATPTPTLKPTPTPTPTLKPTPTPTQTPAVTNYEITDSSKFMNLSECKLSTNLQGSEHYGFPRPENLIPTLGEHRSIALFVYFDDLPFEQRQFDEWKNNQIPTLEKYLAAMSYGKLKYKVDIFDKPIRIGKSVLTYNLDTAHDAPRKPNANASGLISDAVFAVDSEIDFSKYEFINVITPWTRLIGFEGTTGVRLNADGKQFSFASFGPIREYLDDPKKKIWLLHEVGHMMGLIHQFNVRGVWGPTGFPIWSAMADGGSSAPEFMAWERFLLGWLSAEQVRCIENFDQGVFTSKLSPLSAIDNEAKTILIKLGGSQILVIESRRSSDLSFLSKEEEGVLVYTIDVNTRGNDGAANLVFNTPKIRNSPNGGGLVGTLQSGEKVTSGGIKVEILSSDASGDIVRVSKG